MSDTAIGIVCLVIAAVSAVGAVTAWTGLRRRWARQFLSGAVGSFPITLLPSIACMCLSGGLMGLGAAGVIQTFAGVASLVGMLFFVLFLWNPRWWGPRWYREVRAGLESGAISPALQDEVTALVVLGFSEAPGDSSSAAVAARRFHGQEPLEKWRAVTWVLGPEGAGKAHALARPGAVDGRLELYRDGLAFAAHEIEDRLRDSPTMLAVEEDELRGSWAVAPGSGPDGRRRPAAGLTYWLARRIVPRLVIATNDGALLFETYGANEKAQRIRTLYDLEQTAPRAREDDDDGDSTSDVGPPDRIVPL